ncbi:MAG: alpha/beta fold hydrolase [Pseudomonadota bacterium]
MSTYEVRRFAAHGLTLVGDVGGPENAPTVVLMHGGGQTRHSWAGTMDRLVAHGYHVINLDARGHGESDWAPDGNYHPSEQARDLWAVLKTVRRPVALVGASMGGMTAFHAIGSSDTPIADALVMVDIVLKPAPAGADRIKAFMGAYPNGFATVEEAADAVATYYPERRRPKNIGGLRKNLRLREDGRFRWHWDPRILDMGQRAEPPGPFETMSTLAPNVTLPTLLVRGGKSDVVDDEGVADMLRLVPQTEVFEVPGAGHMVAGDMNDPFSAGVIAFLERHLPTGD